MSFLNKAGTRESMLFPLAVLLFLALLGLPTSSAQANSCLRARALYDQALEVQGEARIRLLQESAALCPTFEAFYQLGKARFRAGHLVRAQESFREALGLAGTPKASVRVLANLGQAYQAQGKLLEAVDSYKAALQTMRSLGAGTDRLEQALKQTELQVIENGLNSRLISRALRYRGFQAEPSLDLRILFEYDRARLTPAGKEVSASLGRAINDPFFANKTFVLIGHTDKRGTAEYNQALSEQRARAVAVFLNTGFKGMADRIRTEGRGKRELIYLGEGEDDHRLNRRVEIKILN